MGGRDAVGTEFDRRRCEDRGDEGVGCVSPSSLEEGLGDGAVPPLQKKNSILDLK